MIRPEHVRLAKRVAVVVGAIGTLGGVAYAAANAVAKAEDVERRVARIEHQISRLPADVARLDGKLDALMSFFRVPNTLSTKDSP